MQSSTYHFDVIFNRSLDHSYDQYKLDDSSSFNSFTKDLCFSVYALSMAQNIVWLMKNNWNAKSLENRALIDNEQTIKIINDIVGDRAIVNCSTSYLSSAFTMPLFRKNRSLICLNLNFITSHEELKAILEHEMSHVKNYDADKKLGLFFFSGIMTCYLIYKKSLKHAYSFNLVFNFLANHFIVREFEKRADDNVSMDLGSLNALKGFLNRIYLSSSNKNKENFNKWIKSASNLKLVDRAIYYLLDPEHPYFQDRIDSIDSKIKEIENKNKIDKNLACFTN